MVLLFLADRLVEVGDGVGIEQVVSTEADTSCPMVVMIIRAASEFQSESSLKRVSADKRQALSMKAGARVWMNCSRDIRVCDEGLVMKGER